MVRSVTLLDAVQISEIYNYYILNTTVTFEEEIVSPEIMRDRIAETIPKYPWLVFEQEGKVIGYAYATAWKSRCAYKFSVEVSVYLHHGQERKGIGSALYSELIERLRERDLHGIIGGIALPNDECVGLHHKFGFEKVAHFREVGYKFNKWIDVAYYERILKLY